MKTESKLILTFLGCVFIIFWILNTLTPASLQDDILYKFAWTGIGRADLTKPIHSIGDVIVSQYYHYFYQNGRVVPHVLMQIFDGVFPKWVFNPINALAFCSLILLIVKVATGRLSLLHISITLFAILFFSPSFDETMLWMAGSFNYLWSSVFALIYLLIIQNLWNKNITIKYVLLSPIVIVLVWINEAAVIPIGMVLGVYMVFQVKSIYKKAVFPFVLILLFGVALTVFAPSTLSRLGATDSTDTRITLSVMIMERIKTFIVTIFELRIFWFLIVGLSFTWFKKRNIFKNYIHSSWLLLAVSMSSLLVFFLCAKHYPRVRFTSEIFSLVAFLALFDKYEFSKLTNSVLLSVSNVLSLGLILPILYYSWINYEDYKYCEKQLMQPGKTLILTRANQIPSFFDQYVMQYVDFATPRVWYFACVNSPENAALYGKPEIHFFPENLYFDISYHPAKYHKFNSTSNCRLYAKQLSNGEKINDITYILDKGEVEKPRSMTTIQFNGNVYCVATKPIDKYKSEHIKSIVYK